jgi:hypothetical protein
MKCFYGIEGQVVTLVVVLTSCVNTIEKPSRCALNLEAVQSRTTIIGLNFRLESYIYRYNQLGKLYG